MKKRIGASFLAGLALATLVPGLAVHAADIQTHTTAVTYTSTREPEKISTYTLDIPATMDLLEDGYKYHRIAVSEYDIIEGKRLDISVSGIDDDNNIRLTHTNGVNYLDTQLIAVSETTENNQVIHSVAGTGTNSYKHLTFEQPQIEKDTIAGDYAGILIFKGEIVK